MEFDYDLLNDRGLTAEYRRMRSEVSEPEPAPRRQNVSVPPNPAELIREYGQLVLPEQPRKNPRGNISYLNIIGQIEGHSVMPANNKTTKYEHVIPQLLAVAENPETDGLLIILNTVGGDVEAGLAIAELISGIGKPSVSLVLGGGHSIGVPLAVAAQVSFIAPSATMTLHPLRMNGTVIGAPQTYDYFDKMQERIIEFIVKNSGVKRDKLRALMLETERIALDVGTVLIGQEAADAKIIDRVGGLNEAMEALYGLIGKTQKKPRQSKKK